MRPMSGLGGSSILIASLVIQALPSTRPTGQSLDVPSRVRLVLEPERRNAGALEPAVLVTAAQVLQRRLEAVGARDATVRQGAGERLVVEASGVRELGRLEALLLRVGRLEFRITDASNRFHDAIPEIDRALSRAGVRGPRQPTANSVAQQFGVDTGKAQGDVTDFNAPAALSSVLYQGQVPGEYRVPEEQVPVAESLLARSEVRRLIPRGLELRWGTDIQWRGARAFRALYAVERRPIMNGEELEKASARRDILTNQSVVTFELSRRGGRIFERETACHVNDYLAIILDDRVQGQPPVIKGQIGRDGQIELGSRPLKDAQDLAVILTTGSLPARFVLVEEQVLGPSPSPGHGIDLWFAAAVVVLWIVVLFAVSRRRATPG